MSTVQRRRTRLADIPDYEILVYCLVIVWGFGDVLSTFLAAFATGGAANEINPLVERMLVIEPLLVVALKAGVVLYAGIVLLECREIVQRVPGWRIWFVGVIVAGTLVVANNTAVALAVVV